MIFGSEGSLGIITSAIFKIFPLLEVQEDGCILFRSFEDGVGFICDLAQSGQQPASVRLVDNNQLQFSQTLKPASTGIKQIKNRLEKWYVTKLRAFDPQKMVACILLFEGQKLELKAQKATVYRLAQTYGGCKAGAENGRRGYEMTFAIASIRDFAMTLNAVAELSRRPAHGVVPWSSGGELSRGFGTSTLCETFLASHFWLHESAKSTTPE